MLPRYIMLEKAVGETPLSCVEAYRHQHPECADTPMAYAGRLDPMASGTLLILIGDECKRQSEYHGLDKAYDFSVLLGISSDTGDVLGRLEASPTIPTITEDAATSVTRQFIGAFSAPYPRFSSKTVQGRPLHEWTVRGEIDTITIPTHESDIYQLIYTGGRTMQRTEVVERALEKIDTIPPVTDERKAIGNDFRRRDVRADWRAIAADSALADTYNILSFHCIASSGTYMRTLAEKIAVTLGTTGLAWHIHRTDIGTFDATQQCWQHRY